MAERTFASGERVVLGKREDSMVKFRWSGNEPDGLDELEMPRSSERSGKATSS